MRLFCSKCDGEMTLERSNIGRDMDEEEWSCEECEHTQIFTVRKFYDGIDENGYALITTVHRSDIENALSLSGFMVDSKIAHTFTDDELRKLSGRMANDYCEQLYWSSLGTLAENIINNRE